MQTRNLPAGTAFVLVLLTGSAQAVTQPVVANIAFDTPLAVSKNKDIDFGIMQAAHAGTYVITPAGAVSASNGGYIIGGSQQGGGLVIAGSATQTIDISVNNYIASAGVIPSNATCQYNNGAPGSCALTSQAAPDKGKALLIGVTVNVDGSQKAGDRAAPTFDIIVNYH